MSLLLKLTCIFTVATLVQALQGGKVLVIKGTSNCLAEFQNLLKLTVKFS